MSAVLHFVYDPLCGWCYCAEPLVNAARQVEGLSLALHGGGLWPEPTRLPEPTRRYIQQADARVAAISGQPFGDSYLQGLLLDPEMTLESRPTTAAILAAAALDESKALAMLQGIQHAHYEHGRHVVRHEVLGDIAVACGLDRSAWEAALAEVDVDAHIAQTRQFMQRIGAGGFPAFVLQVGDRLHAVPHQQYASDPAGFADWLGRAIATA